MPTLRGDSTHSEVHVIYFSGDHLRYPEPVWLIPPVQCALQYLWRGAGLMGAGLIWTSISFFSQHVMKLWGVTVLWK